MAAQRRSSAATQQCSSTDADCTADTDCNDDTTDKDCENSTVNADYENDHARLRKSHSNMRDGDGAQRCVRPHDERHQHQWFYKYHPQWRPTAMEGAARHEGSRLGDGMYSWRLLLTDAIDAKYGATAKAELEAIEVTLAHIAYLHTQLNQSGFFLQTDHTRTDSTAAVALLRRLDIVTSEFLHQAEIITDLAWDLGFYLIAPNGTDMWACLDVVGRDAFSIRTAYVLRALRSLLNEIAGKQVMPYHLGGKRRYAHIPPKRPRAPSEMRAKDLGHYSVIQDFGAHVRKTSKKRRRTSDSLSRF